MSLCPASLNWPWRKGWPRLLCKAVICNLRVRSENQLEYQYVPEHELTEAQNLKHTDIIEYKSSLKI